MPADRGLEGPGPLEVFSWDGYFAPDVLDGFEAATGVPVRVSTFYDMNQAISKLRTGAVRPDVFVPTLDVLGRLIVAGLLQPLQPASVPNLANVWPELQSPFYDVGSRYSVPYTVYSTGIGWRSDLAIDPGSRVRTPGAIFWDPAYRGRVFVLDDYRAALQLAAPARGRGHQHRGCPASSPPPPRTCYEMARTDVGALVAGRLHLPARRVARGSTRRGRGTW